MYPNSVGEFKKLYKASAYRPKLFSKNLFYTISIADFKPRFSIPSIYYLGFLLRIRVPSYEGCFDGPTNGQWCFPWNWYNLYYAVRIAPHHKNDGVRSC